MSFNDLRRACIAASLMTLTTVAASASPPAEIAIPGEKIFPESMTSSADGTVFIGSILTGAVFRAMPGAATAEAWIKPGTDDLHSIFGVLADDKSNTLWVCSNTLGKPGDPPPPPASLHAFDLKTGTPKGNYAFPTAGSLCNDIAIGSEGSAYATDTGNMSVVRLKKGGAALETWAGNGAFGEKGGVVDGIAVLGKRVLVNTLATSKLYSVPIEAGGQAGTVVEVKLDRPVDHPDGMRSFGKNGVLVVEGGSGGRLSRITLKGDTGTSATVKQGYPDGPVAVTVVGTTAYVLEGQLAALMKRPPDPTVKLNPFHATAVDVGKP